MPLHFNTHKPERLLSKTIQITSLYHYLYNACLVNKSKGVPLSRRDEYGKLGKPRHEISVSDQGHVLTALCTW